FNTTGYGFFNSTGRLAEALIKSDGADGYRTTSVIKDQDYVQNVMGIAKKPNAPAHGHGLYCGWKNRYEWSDVSLNWGGWSPFPATNFRFMRYAEVLLSAAEAHFNDGNTGLALNYVNQVRDRAQAPLYTSIDMDKIKLERQVELCMEGQRYMDLVRWGDAATVLATQGRDIEQLDIDAQGNWILTPDAASDPTYGFKQGVNELLPFPQREIDQNPNIRQNPGY
ncbi:MAG: RagB/SusD family nutrient uptake outer membrane protein, partial [Muribaculaceae bacterium]|nr:RagB/SusD family nutrient uptake outer membrane protein [Muribaculaceae bacterium]